MEANAKVEASIGINNVRVAQVRVMAQEALDAAHKRVALLARAGGRATRRPATRDAEEMLSIKVTIKDSAALDKIAEAGAIAYLAARGWQKERDLRRNDMGAGKPALGGEWIKKTRKGKALLLVPAEHVGDRLLRIFDLVDGLEQVEGRSQLLIYRDLLTACRAAPAKDAR